LTAHTIRQLCATSTSAMDPMTSIPVSYLTDWYNLLACRNDTPTDTKLVTMLNFKTDFNSSTKYYLPDCEQNVWEHSFLLIQNCILCLHPHLNCWKAIQKLESQKCLHQLWTWIFALKWC